MSAEKRNLKETSGGIRLTYSAYYNCIEILTILLYSTSDDEQFRVVGRIQIDKRQDTSRIKIIKIAILDHG